MMFVLEPKAIAIADLSSALGLFRKDLEALPAEAYTQRFAEQTRTVADIVYEVNLVNDHVRRTICGEPLFDWPEGGWITAPADFQTKEVVLAAYDEGAERLMASLTALTEEDFAGTVTTEHGERSRFERCRFMAIHLWYHCGQLNFIQTLLGDSKWHWN